MRFRLIRGTFIDGNRRKFKAPPHGQEDDGPVIQSDRRLDQVWKNKFILLNPPGAAPEEEEVPEEEEEEEVPVKKQPGENVYERAIEEDEEDEDEEEEEVIPEDEEEEEEEEEPPPPPPKKKSRRTKSPKKKKSVNYDEPQLTVRAIHKGGGRWAVVEVVDGIPTKNAIHSGTLSKDEAAALVVKS